MAEESYSEGSEFYISKYGTKKRIFLRVARIIEDTPSLADFFGVKSHTGFHFIVSFVLDIFTLLIFSLIFRHHRLSYLHVQEIRAVQFPYNF